MSHIHAQSTDSLRELLSVVCGLLGTHLEREEIQSTISSLYYLKYVR